MDLIGMVWGVVAGNPLAPERVWEKAVRRLSQTAQPQHRSPTSSLGEPTRALRDRCWAAEREGMRGLASVHTQSVFQADRPTPGLTPQQPSVRQAVYHHIKGLAGDGDKHHHRLHASTVADAAAERRRRVRWRRTSTGRPGRARVNPAAFRVAGREGRPATQARCCLGEG